MSVTHVAGPVVGFKSLDRVIQRCAVCGEKLEDLQPSCVMMVTTDTVLGPNEFPRFAEAHLIRVTGFDDDARSFIDLGPFETVDLPDDFCLSLVER